MAKLPTGLRKRGPAIEIRVMVGGKTYTENLKALLTDHIASVKRREQIKSQLTHGDIGLAFARFEDVAQDWINV